MFLQTDNAQDCQKEYFCKVDAQRFRWLTQNALLRFSQELLLSTLNACPQQKVLEVGCGEGANLYGLRDSRSDCVGIDVYPQKLFFAAAHNKKARFIASDALRLPFRDNSFELVFCKDVLHHIAGKEKVIEEMLRVCRPGGEVVIIEANGRNFFWRIFAAVIPAERGVKENTAGSLKRLLSVRDLRGAVTAFIYVPLACIFLSHYKFGWKDLGDNPLFVKLGVLLTRWARGSFFKSFHPYLRVSRVKEGR